MGEPVGATSPLRCSKLATYALQPAFPCRSHHLLEDHGSPSGLSHRWGGGITEAQVNGGLTWAFGEPPSGFEPETYALRARQSVPLGLPDRPRFPRSSRSEGMHPSRAP
jgi:hypothetical protein